MQPREEGTPGKGPSPLQGHPLGERDCSLFLADATLTLKSLTPEMDPLSVLEPILDAVVPVWRSKHPEHYLKYASFVRLGPVAEVGPDAGAEESSAWAGQMAILDQHFRGESSVLGTQVPHRVYVANYLGRDEVLDNFATHVSLTGLDPMEHAARFSGPASPLASAWVPLHGNELRSLAAAAKFHEGSSESSPYFGSGVFGRHFTAVHSAQREGSAALGVETTMPLTKEAKQRFVLGASGLCYANVVSVLEFTLSPALFLGGAPPELPGLALARSSQTVGTTFACSLHHFVRGQAGLSAGAGSRTLPPYSPCISAVSAVSAEDADATAPEPGEQLLPPGADVADEEPPLVEADDLSEAPVLAARLLLRGCHGAVSEDLPVCLLDLGAVERRADLWRRLLPRVEPFYAVKCNPDPALLRALFAKWQEFGVGGFDCASPAEMDLAIGAGADAARQIVYANPCKQGSAVEYARSAGVRWVVFDNAAELVKLGDLYPGAELLIRVQTDDSLAQCPLSNKFGAAVEDAGALLEQARDLGLRVVGVSFHVGSGCSQVGAFRSALQRARAVFDEAARVGFEPKVLDIGGGFPGWDEAGEATFEDHARDISEVLEDKFGAEVRVIAEPGRFFAASVQALVATVVSVASSQQGFRYYLNDGVYGSFNSLIYDHARVPDPVIFRDGAPLAGEPAGAPGPCTVFGPTCDGFDLVASDLPLPRLHVGDRLLFPNMGAYTSAASTRFNGFAPAKAFLYRSRQA
ncbi:unnamed protein product [Prorocentrum cordatum]|uniref:Rhodanese domain-containing protein n=1 Tax=Prorocentrum cordatum TaxID=2364126 RepID=A0ABN9U7L4_9DINO|nr:unnamed protein product [Polarella glacialis]